MRKRKSDSSDLGVLLLDVKQVAELLTESLQCGRWLK